MKRQNSFQDVAEEEGVCRWLLDLAALCLGNWRHAPSASPFHQLVISAKGADSRATQHRLALHCVY